MAAESVLDNLEPSDSGDSGTESDVGDTTPDIASSSESSGVKRFLDHFHAPKQSTLTRKRAIR